MKLRILSILSAIIVLAGYAAANASTDYEAQFRPGCCARGMFCGNECAS